MPEEKLTEEEFVKKAIKKLRDPKKSKGIHSVYTGFNKAFKEYFETDPVEATTKLAEEGVIETRFVKGGAMLYFPGDAPEMKDPLEQILS